MLALSQVFTLWLAIVVVIGSIGEIAVSSPLVKPVSQISGPIPIIADFVRSTGNDTVIRGVIADALGLGSEDINVRQRAIKYRSEKLTHVCSIGLKPALDDVVFFASVDEETGDAMIWRVSRAGEVLKTVRFSEDLAVNLPNDSFRGQFVAEREFFRRWVLEHPIRATPNSPP